MVGILRQCTLCSDGFLKGEQSGMRVSFLNFLIFLGHFYFFRKKLKSLKKKERENDDEDDGRREGGARGISKAVRG